MKKIERNIFLQPTSGQGKITLKRLESAEDILLTATLLSSCLAESNALAGKALYLQTEKEIESFLTDISELYGVFEMGTSKLIGILAVEEDSIERIAVAKAYQRKGIGQALMQFAHEKLGANYADVYIDNLPALHFFESCGLSLFDETTPEPGDLMAEDPYKIIHLMY